MSKHCDPQIKNLVKRLNQNGFETYTSCQGLRTRNDNHNIRANIGFRDRLPMQVETELKLGGITIEYIPGNGVLCSAQYFRKNVTDPYQDALDNFPFGGIQRGKMTDRDIEIQKKNNLEFIRITELAFFKREVTL